MIRRERSAPVIRASGAIEMRSHENRKARRPWIRPLLQAQSTLTTVTQVGSPVPLSLLFLQTSQCFDGFGQPVPC
jgi:hypothetical protein